GVRKVFFFIVLEEPCPALWECRAGPPEAFRTLAMEGTLTEADARVKLGLSYPKVNNAELNCLRLECEGGYRTAPSRKLSRGMWVRIAETVSKAVLMETRGGKTGLPAPRMLNLWPDTGRRQSAFHQFSCTRN